MKPEVPQELLGQAKEWSQLHRWERRELGKALRRLGLTYSEIREVIPVPKSTLSNWCHGISLTDTQVDAIRLRSHSPAGVPRDTQRKRRAEIEQIRLSAASAASGLIDDALFVAGVALYWAEGSKSRNDLAISNTDPFVLTLFVGWVRSYLDEDAEFRLSLHLHDGNDEAMAQAYWRGALDLPSAEFTKSFVKPPGTGHRKNQLAHGVCRVRVCRSADHWHRTMEWIQHMRDHIA